MRVRGSRPRSAPPPPTTPGCSGGGSGTRPEGEHSLRVRAIDGEGGTQTAEEAPPAPDGSTGLDRIKVKVS